MRKHAKLLVAILVIGMLLFGGWWMFIREDITTPDNQTEQTENAEEPEVLPLPLDEVQRIEEALNSHDNTKLAEVLSSDYYAAVEANGGKLIEETDSFVLDPEDSVSFDGFAQIAARVIDKDGNEEKLIVTLLDLDGWAITRIDEDER